ncbi:multiheme c-type cytochrome [Thiohalobacter sp. IOR34]|uniref:multiheme c-type cytochrome n=1 Tax=Thiohalobacter sp. IOR34 TaxID=3057176 RepID=UPI0025AFD587|nr:multiheme c-type cytochrome [Thiohalobacter sp. IOR34]WJW76504.1 multiheme c-type cytochrome [Thiohalobacter sp. IOR34]
MKRVPRYVWIPVILALIAVPAGFWYVDWSRGGAGAGLYSRAWMPEAVFAYWDPADFYAAPESLGGSFQGEQCVQCHQAVTPGIVNDWRASRHSQPKGRAPVYCSDCHGSDHQSLHLPTPEVCGGCHATQHVQFEDEKRLGFPSHALALERALDAPHFVDKPKAEVSACLQCHSVAAKCDSCHTRHRFNAAEARRPEACITCHSGPPHPDDETFYASAHGRLYLAEGDEWDWSKPLVRGNYKAPTCAYCHMQAGRHQVADKPIHKFGIRQVNPLTSANAVKRRQWVELCSDCHEAGQASAWLAALDAERKQAWQMLRGAEAVLKDLRAEGLLYPNAGERPPYPNSTLDRLLPKARIGFYEGQASAFYNVSPIERDYFEMWYFDNLAAYKGAAHGDAAMVKRGHAALEKDLQAIRAEAQRLRELGPVRPDPRPLWFSGEYTEHNLENN